MQVELIDSMGSDLTVVNAARVSFNKESEWEYSTTVSEPDKFGLTYELSEANLSDKDARLIHYLASHNHWTPFGHCFATFRIKAPIFVARQLVKHTVGLVWNEVSRRYVDSEPELYWPEQWRGRPANTIKQGSGEVVEVEWGGVKDNVELLIDNYKYLLDQGVSPEFARMILPQNMYTEWYWSGSLAAWARVCKLRCKPDAQEQTRYIAEQINAIMFDVFPVSWDALLNG